jgi:hypothetical protein
MNKLATLGTASTVFAIAGAAAMGAGRPAPKASPYALFGQPTNWSSSEHESPANYGEFYQPAARERTNINTKRKFQHSRRAAPSQQVRRSAGQEPLPSWMYVFEIPRPLGDVALHSRRWARTRFDEK